MSYIDPNPDLNNDLESIKEHSYNFVINARHLTSCGFTIPQIIEMYRELEDLHVKLAYECREYIDLVKDVKTENSGVSYVI